MTIFFILVPVVNHMPADSESPESKNWLRKAIYRVNSHEQ